MNKKIFGRRLRELRKNKNLTQEKLAEIIETEESHISALERGINFPSYSTLEKLAKALNVEYHELFFFLHFREEDFLRQENLKMLEEASPEQQKVIYHFLSAILA
jgi:transcriptional regulator with XRE-family HTH domain